MRYDLTMVARGNSKDISFTFAQMIERTSADVTLYPGDVVELEIEYLGILRNVVGEAK